MPRPRTPLEKARVTGANRHHPARFAGRSDPKTSPLGAPPDWMRGKQIEAWEMFRCELPWLAEADRAVLEIATGVRARLMSGDEVGVQALTLLRQCLGQMGATPADRSKVTVPDEQSEDPAERFFN